MSVLSRFIETEELQALLCHFGWHLDKFAYARPSDEGKPIQTFQFMAPQVARDLYVFSLHAAEWLGSCHLQALVFNSPNHYNLAEEQAVGTALFGHSYKQGSLPFGTHVLTEIGADPEDQLTNLMRTAQVIFYTFMCFGHCQIFSASGKPGAIVSVQDGCLYLQNFGPELTCEPLDINRNIYPEWAWEEYEH